MKARKLETVVGYNGAIDAIKSWSACWNESNGEGRMQACGLRASDSEGSGEWYEAVCVNLDTATCAAEEIYEIQTCY